ncbi:MAG: hypothetical protein JWR50_2418 [Mucilaginibacter sp.]|nr:hypothetical protein [Mucilaginibacter sp.]
MRSIIDILILVVILSGLIGKSAISKFTYQNKNSKTEQLILEHVHALPEVKEWFITAKRSKPGLILNQPGSRSKYYSVQVGISNNDMFRTNYYLFIDPKNFSIYFWDELDTASSLITLQQWRHWRNNPGFNKMHKYKNGKLVIL